MSWSTTNVSDVSARLNVLGITQNTRDLLAGTWPLIASHVEEGIDAYFVSCQALPWVAEKLLPNKVTLRAFYSEHFRILFSGWLDERYQASLGRKRELDAAIDLKDARPHFIFSHFVLRAAVAAISRYHRFSAPAAAARITALMQVVAFDGATSLAYLVDDLTHRSESSRAAVDESINTFDTAARSLFGSLTHGSTSLRSASVTMDAMSESTRQVIERASRASHETVESVSLTASATDEIARTIGEIRQQAVGSSVKATQVAEDARTTQETVKFLSASVDRIGSVAEMISDVAGQTNLLALNAAIEAARAGSAGKGFSVVASEVKSLADQTARATEEIAQQIAVIQGATANTAKAIESIAVRIVELTESAGAIASAVDSQSAATEAISHEMQLVLDRTQKNSSAIAIVQNKIAENGKVSSEVIKLAELLSRHADNLASETKAFFVKVRVP